MNSRLENQHGHYGKLMVILLILAAIATGLASTLLPSLLFIFASLLLVGSIALTMTPSERLKECWRQMERAPTLAHAIACLKYTILTAMIKYINDVLISDRLIQLATEVDSGLSAKPLAASSLNTMARIQRYLRAPPEKTNYQQRFEATAFDGEVPDLLVCPISISLMNRPITISTGMTYDLASLKRYADTTKEPLTCPFTKLPFDRKELTSTRPNIFINSRIDDFVKLCEEQYPKSAPERESKAEAHKQPQSSGLLQRLGSWVFGSSQERESKPEAKFTSTPAPRR